MEFFCLIEILLVDSILPHSMYTIFIIKLIKNTITAKNDEVVLCWVYFKLAYVRFSDNNVNVA